MEFSVFDFYILYVNLEDKREGNRKSKISTLGKHLRRPIYSPHSSCLSLLFVLETALLQSKLYPFNSFLNP